jgi:phenylacetate-CoA ligase
MLYSQRLGKNQDALSHEKIMQAHQRLQKKLKDNISLIMKLIVSVPGTIPRREGGKLNRILDLRKAGVVPV